MNFNYTQYVIGELIDEIEDYKIACYESEDLKSLSKIKNEIKEAEENLAKSTRNLTDEQIEFKIEEFKRFRKLSLTKYYNYISGFFQRAYSLFEGQVQTIQDKYNIPLNQQQKVGNYADFKNNTDLSETNKAVNVVKHKKGDSYKKLLEINSKFLEVSNILAELKKDKWFEYSSAILNIEFNDIINFLNEVETFWFEKIKEAENPEFQIKTPTDKKPSEPGSGK